MNKAGEKISKIVRAENKFAARATRMEGLGTAESELLGLVRQKPGISQKEACSILDMDKGAVAKRAVNLEQKGYLVRKENPADARSQLLYPQSAADTVKNPQDSAQQIFYDWLFEGISAREKDIFNEILDRLYLRSEKERESEFVHVGELLKLSEHRQDPDKGEQQKEKEKKAGSDNKSGEKDMDVWML